MRRVITILAFILLLLPTGPLWQTKAEAAIDHTHVQSVPAGYTAINTIEDLNKVRDNLSGHYILMSDLDLTNATADGGEFANSGAGWSPIGSQAAPFTGIFDGNGYVITGMKIHSVSDQDIYAGLFGYAKGAEIKNIGMEGGSVQADNQSTDSTTADVYAGSLVGYGYNLKISNSYNTGDVNATSLFNSYAGGLAGDLEADYNNTSTVTNSDNTGKINAINSAGGIAGKVYRATITQATNGGEINPTATNGKFAGGIVGYVYGSSTISDAHNDVPVHYAVYGGGIAGYFTSSSIDGSDNSGNLVGNSSSSTGGGIVGYANISTISNSFNEGTISSSQQYTDGGGIAGNLSNNSSIVKSYNTGDVNVTNTAGGMAGDMSSSLAAKTYNTGTIAGDFAGGIGGWLSSGTITDSYNIGTIKGQIDAGGIAGHGSASTIKNTYNVGTVGLSTIRANRSGIAAEFDGTFLNNYSLNTPGVNGDISKTLDEMKAASTYAGFDFTSVWSMDENAAYKFPVLNGLPQAGEENAVAISLKSNPKTAYTQGDDFDVTGGVLSAETNFGNVNDVALKADMISGYSPNYLGSQSVRISYQDAYTYLDVTVVKKDTTPPAKPVVNQVTDQDTSVTGSAEAGSKVEIQANGSVIGSGNAGSDGNFNITIPVQKGGTELTVTAADQAGNVSDAAIVDVKDVTPPVLTLVNGVTDQDKTVTGEAEPGTDVKVFLHNQEIGSGQTGADGKFSVDIPVQTGGNELDIRAFDAAGNASDLKSVIVKDITAPAEPTVDKVTDQDSSVTGNAEAGSKVEVSANGTVIGSNTAWTNGGFSVSIPQQKEGTELTVTATDAAGNVSDKAVITVSDGLAPVQPVINDVTDQSTAVTGKGEAGTTIEVSAAGKVIATGTVAADGQFSIPIPIQKAETQLTVTSTDAAGNKSESGTVVQDVTPPVKPAVNSVTNQDSFIEGEAEAGTYIEVSVNTWIIGSGKVGADGQFNIKITPQTAGTNIVVTSNDAYGNVSDAASMIVKSGTLKGWAKRNGNWYYYDPSSGEMATGWLKSNQKRYYFDNYGVMQMGWEKVSGKWYYFNAGGDMKIGWLLSGGKWYYLNSSGAMQTGWTQISGKWYYFNSGGDMKTGWLYTGGKWYYFYSSGAMAANTTVNGYRFDKSGIWIK